jgi:hypothetical protein
MASSGNRPTELDSPLTPAAIRRTWSGYQRALERMAAQPDAIPVLQAHLTEINARLQAQMMTAMTDAVGDQLRQRVSSLDTLQLRSPRSTAALPTSPTDRGARPSPSPQPGALDLLMARKGLGAKLAARLVVGSARAEHRRTP